MPGTGFGEKKVSVDEFIKAGVSAKNERGQMYDRFRGRITFPYIIILAKQSVFRPIIGR